MKGDFKKTISANTGYNEKESTGVGTGLSERMDFNSDTTMCDATFNEQGSAAPGFTRQIKGKRTEKSVSKGGQSFMLEGCKD
jgi:hypothetical protein